jgi:NAD(P)H-dependent flavin oxidoreductase YrpB (nitropropane dioxygenase family)
VCELLGIEVPIFGFSHSPEVVAAIARGGGCGVLGVARELPDVIPGLIAGLREAVGDAPIVVDLMLPAGMPADAAEAEAGRAALPAAHRAFVDGLRRRWDVPVATRPNFFSTTVRTRALFAEQVDAVLAADVDAVATAVGLPPEVLARVRAGGRTTIALVGTPRHARAALAAGAQVLVAQGYDAGGHTGTIGTMSLVPQVVALAGDVPVIAAGGIACGAQVAAALAMGAQGAWLGTAWLGATEARLHPALLAKLVAAGSEDTTITRAHSGKPCRVVRSAWSDAWDEPDAPEPLAMPWQHALTGELLAAIEEHGVAEPMYEAAGQSVAWLRGAEPAAEILGRLVRETDAALARLAPGGARLAPDAASPAARPASAAPAAPAAPTAPAAPDAAPFRAPPDPPAHRTDRRHRGDLR